MNKRIFTCAVMAVIMVMCAGCTKYEPDYTIWREGIIQSYDIGEDKTVIKIADAYPNSYGELLDVSDKAEVLFYGINGNDYYEKTYVVKDNDVTFTIYADSVDNYSELCDYIQTAGDRILKITLTNGNLTGLCETGYVLAGGE